MFTTNIAKEEIKMAKILVVDDSENTRYSLKTLLELEEYKVETASCGKEAISKVKKETPDLIIMDIMMPDMDGWETVKRMRKELKIKSPVLFLTARADDESRKLSKEVYGAAGYLIKPFLNEELVDKIKKILK